MGSRGECEAARSLMSRKTRSPSRRKGSSLVVLVKEKEGMIMNRIPEEYTVVRRNEKSYKRKKDPAP